MADIKARLLIDTKDAKKSIDTVKSAFKGLVAAVGVRELGQIGNSFQEIQNKLRTITPANKSVQDSFQTVVNIARETRSGLEETADLYFRLSKASQNLGITGDETTRITELFAKTLALSGAGAQEAASAILQFGQAMGSGVLQGDEFRSLNESNAVLMDILADKIGKPRGELKKLASEGKISAQVLASALLEAGNEIDVGFGQTTQTLAQSLKSIRNEFIILVGKIESETGVFAFLAETFKKMGENLDIVAGIFIGFFTAALVGQIIAVVTGIAALRAELQKASGAAIIFQSATGIGLVKALAGLAVGTASVFAMNAAFEEMNDDIDGNTKSVDKLKGETAKLFQESENLTDEQKKQKTINDENARILARQLEEFGGITDQLKLETEELQTALGLQQDLADASEIQKDLIEAIADIEADRADALRDLAALTEVDLKERQAKEQEINDEYDERIRLTKEANELLLDTGTFNQVKGFYNEITQATADYRDELALLKAAQIGSSRDELRNLSELITLYNETEQTLIRLNESFFGAGAGGGIQSQRAAELVQLGKMTQEEADAYNERIINFFEYEKEMIAALSKFQKQREEIEKMPTLFGAGFEQAFEDFKRSVSDAATFGTNIFNTMTQGWSDAFVKFAETGKLSFKDLFKTLMTEIVKMMANKLFLALFGGAGSLFGGLFAGFFNNGGTIPAGKIGIVGESGPEIVRGPGTVISTRDSAEMLGGNRTHITYNIQAVDAPSFQALVARDPEFIFNVSRAGARRVPG